ncbi:MAG: cysteine hydrolase [Nocardia sp.]|nr:cysteine hydrolase [Nocardia sp.]
MRRVYRRPEPDHCAGARPVEDYDLVAEDSVRNQPHDWHIEEREYLRHEDRRGRRFAYPELDPRRTALVVVDMVPFHVTGNPYCRGIVPNIDRIARALRTAGGIVTWVVPEAGAPLPHAIEFFGPHVAESYSRSGGFGPPDTRLWPDLVADDLDLFVEKSAISAFCPGRCPLPRLLEQRGIDTVLITGTVTDVCCESSARDASTLGFRVIMVADGNATRRDRDHNATLHTIYRSFGDVRPTSEVLAMIEGAG